MKRLILFFAILLFPLMVCAEGLEYYKVYAPKDGMSADDIMKIVYHNKYSLFAKDYELPESEVYYIDKTGFTRKKFAKRYRIVKAGADNLSYKDLIVVTYPVVTKGLAILTWTYEDPKKEQNTWLWVPSLKKVRKVSASEDDDAFMGSDFTVEEVSTRKFEDETYKLLRKDNFEGYTFEHTGEMKFKDEPCFVIECTPKKPHWYYSKRIIWVDKEIGGNIFEEYYDKNGKLFKTLFREWTWYEPQTLKYPTQIDLECKDLRTGHRTVIINNDQKYDQGVSEQNFTVKSLMRSRW